MKKLTIIFSAIVILGLVLTACATPPTEEMNKALDAVTRAENDPNAVTYAGNTLVRARDALTRMQSEANAKRYEAAKNYAAEAVSAAEKAIADGRTGAARAREEASAVVNSLSTPLAETANSLSAAQQQEKVNLDFDALAGEMDSANKTYDDAQKSLSANDYGDAVTKGQNVRSLISDINTQINEAAQATSRKQ